jgi:hypothetical protein
MADSLRDAVRRLARDPRTDAAVRQWFRLLLRGDARERRARTRGRARPAVPAEPAVTAAG